jgi:hypothetical protein
MYHDPCQVKVLEAEPDGYVQYETIAPVPLIRMHYLSGK